MRETPRATPQALPGKFINFFIALPELKFSRSTIGPEILRAYGLIFFIAAFKKQI
jgi:hypothetical protein